MVYYNLLNDFQKKTIIASLSKYNPINISLYLTKFDEAYYIIFFEIDGFIFSECIKYSSNFKNNKPVDFSVFLKTCTDALDLNLISVENMISRDYVKKGFVSERAAKICQEVNEHYSHFVNIGLKKSYCHSNDFFDTVYSYLISGKTPRSALKKVFKDHGLFGPKFIDKIKNLPKHKAEIEKFNEKHFRLI